MKSWLIAHGRAARQAARRMRAEPAGSLLSVLVIGVALMLPLMLYTLFANVSAAASRVQADPSINVYFALGTAEAEARAAAERARKLPGVRGVRFISRDAALTEMRRMPSLADMLSSLDANPLPHALSVQPATTEAASLGALKAGLGALPGVEQVIVDFEWAQKLRRFATFAERVVALLGILLAVAVAFVTGNTIRLQILTQRDEIEVSRLIGATRRFVRRPFLYFGALQGALAGVVAVGSVAAVVAWAGGEVAALTASYGSDFTLLAPTPAVAGFVIGAAALLGWTGAFLSVWLYLRKLAGKP